ncbi:hypothetical protein AR457_38365 [Streptomyces agglomeratus]|nr:hypothetical protein AR457_38365 [Streptomyces agglomeratus]
MAFEISGAQLSQTSSSVHTRPTVGSWRRMSTTVPAQWTRVCSWVAQRWARQWHEAFGRTVAALAWAATCWAAKTRSAARSLERGGIRHAAVLQVTVAERSACPVRRMVQARPGMRSVEDSL